MDGVLYVLSGLLAPREIIAPPKGHGEREDQIVISAAAPFPWLRSAS